MAGGEAKRHPQGELEGTEDPIPMGDRGGGKCKSDTSLLRGFRGLSHTQWGSDLSLAKPRVESKGRELSL